MALTCARCGAQNPDGNLYCQTCGTPLAAGAAHPPYYSPVGATAAPVHRAPMMLIVAGVVALVVLMAGFGTAFAVLANHGGATPSGGVGELPSPTPAVTPSPGASPTATPTTLGSTTESNNGLSVPVPQGWSVAARDNESIVLSDPNGDGSVSLASGPSIPTQTTQDNKKTVDDYFKSKYPDSRNCPNTSAKSTAFNGASGISWTVCFTLTSGSSAIPAAASLFAGANSSGSVYYIVMVLTRQDNLQAYLDTAKPVLQGVQWKLT